MGYIAKIRTGYQVGRQGRAARHKHDQQERQKRHDRELAEARRQPSQAAKRVGYAIETIAPVGRAVGRHASNIYHKIEQSPGTRTNSKNNPRNTKKRSKKTSNTHQKKNGQKQNRENKKLSSSSVFSDKSINIFSKSGHDPLKMKRPPNIKL